MDRKILSCVLALSVVFTTLFPGMGTTAVWAAPNTRADDKADGKTDEKKDEKAEGKTDEKADDKTDEKTGEESEDKSDEKTEDKSEDKSDNVLKDLPTEWDLTELYADEAALKADIKHAEELLPAFEKYRGKLNSVEGIKSYLEDPDIAEIREIVGKVGMYSILLNSLDSSDPKAGNADAAYTDLMQKFNIAGAFEETEIMELSLEKRQEIFEDEALAPYKYYMRKYTDPDHKVLSEEAKNVKTIMETADVYGNARNVLDNVDIKRPEITYPDGTKGILDDAAYSNITENPEYDHEFRKKAYLLRFSMRQDFANTYASLLEGHIRENWASTQVEGYASSLEASMKKSDIEPEIYDRIIEFAHDMLPKFHEYFAKRKEVLGLDEMMICDLSLPVSGYTPKEMSYEDAMNKGRAGITAWGDEYLETFDRIAKSRHIDVFPSAAKDSGGFEILDIKSTTPFILYNYTGTEGYINVLVHEMGHAVYGQLSNENQIDYNDCPVTFTQEVASTSNEIMFYKNMISNAKTQDEKLYWTDKEVNLFFSAMINQCMYSEFEDYCHKTIENGGSLSADEMNAKWIELVKLYYGDEMTVPDEAGIDWARIPHFYYDYYVYQYATSATYAAAVCNLVEENGQREVDAYLDFLKAGATADPASLLTIAGVDPMDDDTYESAGKLIGDLIDEFIELADSSEKDEKAEANEKAEADTKEEKSGLDTSAMKPWINSIIIGVVTDDTKAELKDDFYLNVNHDYLRDAKLRPGYSDESPLNEAEEQVKERCMEILNDKTLTGRDAEMPRDFYELFLDWDGRNKEGIKPLEPFVEKLKKVSSIDEMTDFLLSDENLTEGLQLVRIGIAPDTNDSSKYGVQILPNGLSLGDAAEYKELTESGKAYKEYREGQYIYMLERFGYSEDEIDGLLEDMFEFEKKTAEHMMTSLDKEGADAIAKQNNPVTMDELKEMSPDYPLVQYMEKRGYSKSKLINLKEPEWLKSLNDLYTEENLNGIRAYLLLQTLSETMDYLDEDAHRKEQELEKKLYGMTESSTDEDDAYFITRSLFSDNMSRVYIDRYLNEGIREEITNLCKDVINTYDEMFDGIDWLSEETRKKAKKKLQAMKINAVYPDKWRDDSMYSITSKEDGGTYHGAILEYNKAFQEEELSKINKEVDKELWTVNILLTNAYYDPQDNSINIIPGFFCDATYRSDMTVEEKYGALGAVIGHEISHAFDINGAQYDENGNFANWWTEEDLDTFRKRGEKLAKFYDNVVTIDEDTPYHGQMVQSESIADMAGIKCMLKMAEKIDDFDYDRFFRAFAYLHADVGTLLSVQNRIVSNVHPLSYLRCNVTIQQFDEFLETYDIKQGDGMYLAPGDRIAVW